MALGPVTGELRAVPAAPPDRRFSHPGISARLMATPRTDSTFRAREQRMPAQVPDTRLSASRPTHAVRPSLGPAHPPPPGRTRRRSQSHRADTAGAAFLQYFRRGVVLVLLLCTRLK